MYKKTYPMLFAVFCLSFGLAIVLPTNDIIRGIAGTPAIGALVAAVYQILKDHASHQKKIELQQKQLSFSLGVTSHMAQIAFDKHVEFCEKYMSEVHETSDTLWTEGPTEKALSHASAFKKLRKEYAAWVTEDITQQLQDFENALFKLGVRSKLSLTTGRPEARMRANEEAEKLWDELLGSVIDQQKKPNENVALESIKTKIRNILGIQELTELRGALIKKAIENIKAV